MTGNSGRGEGGAGGEVSGAEFAGIGVQFGLTILIFVFIGIWVDERLGTSPWLLLLAVFLGAGASFYSIYRKVIAAQRRDAERRAASRERGP